MGLTRQYLRWSSSSVFGVIGSPNGSVVFLKNSPNHPNQQLIASAACERIIIWDAKTGEPIKTLSDGNSEVTSLCANGSNSLIASGHLDGTIRIFDADTAELKVTLSGHKSAVNCVSFDESGMRLVSGGKDTEIVVWDVVNESGLFRLKGHKHGITQLRFMSSEHENILISSSRDTFIKFWDLNTQHCFKTLVGHRSEVWDFVVIRNDTRLITGAGDSELKVWQITFKEDDQEMFNKKLEEEKNGMKGIGNEGGGEGDDDDQFDDENDILAVTRVGSVMRKSLQRVGHMFVDQSERMLVCHGIENVVECFRLRTEEEIKSMLAKRIKKETKKLKRLKDEDAEKHVENEEDKGIVKERTLNDEIERLETFKTASKVKSLDLKCVKNEWRIVTLLANNSIGMHSFKVGSTSQVELTRSITQHGHRSDIRTVSFSSDNHFILSASAESLKIWSRSTHKCIATVTDDAFDYALCSLFVPGDRYCILGTKSGKLQIFEIGMAQMIDSIEASEENQPIWSICPFPNQKGLVSGCEDKYVKFWDYELVANSESKTRKLTLVYQRSLKMEEGVLCVKVSPNSKFVAVSLLDSTVRVYFLDTLKFFLSLYGHKFPVLCMDISYDSTLIVTGSSDKNIKIWGLDFGDCHKSTFSHDDNITAIQFIPKTHYFFSCSKDKTIKQWDADNFEKICTLEGHQAEVWSLAVSPNGKFLVSVSHDKSLRLWEKTEEPLVLEEEQETEREKEFEKNAFSHEESVIPGETNKETAIASKKTIETIKGAEKLIEALNVYKEEIEKQVEYERMMKLIQESGKKGEVMKPEVNPLMNIYNTTCPYRFMLEAVRQVKPNEMEETLLTLPFNYVIDLLRVFVNLLERNWQVELICKCACFIMRVHFGQISSTASLVPTIDKLKHLMADRVKELKDLVGINLAGLQFFDSQLSSREESSLFADATQKRKDNKKKRAKRDGINVAPILTWT